MQLISAAGRVFFFLVFFLTSVLADCGCQPSFVGVNEVVAAPPFKAGAK